VKKVIIDTDPGMDDTIAMVLAAKSPEIQLLGISSVAGNYPLNVTTTNALKTVDHRGGLDAFLMKAKDSELAPRMLEAKRALVKKLAAAS